MISNMTFYDFMHKQILIVIALSIATGWGYIYIGHIYSGSAYAEMIWYSSVVIISLWGYALHKKYLKNNLSLEEKENWLKQVNLFFYAYFLLWIMIFLIYITRDQVELHYIAVATQIGTAVVSSALLVSQRMLARVTLISVMTPLFFYFLFINEFFSYLLAFFTFVLTWVLYYASNNTYQYLIKSRFQAYHDYLTKLGNRRYFIELLEDSLQVQKQNKKNLYLLLVDLDYFKAINDTLGHDVGDELLIAVSKRMDQLSDEYNCKVARLGGDEFCILSPFYDDIAECENVAQTFANNLLQKIKETYQIDSHQLFISASIGVTIIDNSHEINATNVIKEADIAMYEAKSHGRDGVIRFTSDMMEKIKEKFEIERLLHFAIEKDEIKLCFQPQLDLKTKKISCEVLARWNTQTLGEISPNTFIPIAEDNGKIIDLGLYILEQSIIHLKRWDEKNIQVEQLSINISVKQILHKDFILEVEKLLTKHLNKNLRQKLMFEITETSAADDVKEVAQNIKILKKYGIQFSMDDFGTGYSSINYLRELNVDELKIDKVFVSDIAKGEDEKNIIRTILNISKNLNLKVIAEGVETKEQLEFLEKEKCDFVQGNLISKPLNEKSFMEFLKKNS